ncbi:uncharacterized protein G2W53_032480 [Senna tora]|uniref:Uncharacterized protein n=1 Tax=Senna tora TaxID=362788 RepID=A0A834WBV2_9FABA|nr:uncharacterized protein G2W53_032480 [Senna tora]
MEDLEDCTVGEISINGRVETQWKASMDALEHDSGMGTRRTILCMNVDELKPLTSVITLPIASLYSLSAAINLSSST